MSCRSNIEALSRPHDNLEQLAEAVQLQKRLADEKPRVMARFDPLRDKYRVLEKFEVQVPDAQLQLLDSLDHEWARFQVCLNETPSWNSYHWYLAYLAAVQKQLHMCFPMLSMHLLSWPVIAGCAGGCCSAFRAQQECLQGEGQSHAGRLYA